MRALTSILAGFALLLAALPARADLCDDIHKVANRWHALANYIDEHSDGGKLRAGEIKKVAAEARNLAAPSKVLGNALVNVYKGKNEQRIRALGKQILASLEELGGLNDDDDWDEDVKIIDRLVEVLDKVTEECDKG